LWDFLPSLRLRIFSALVGDFSENLREKLARVQKKEKRLRYFLRKILGRRKAENVGREIDARLGDLGREEENELWQQ
jgi:hypothetical protein